MAAGSLFGNTAQRLCARCAVRFFCQMKQKTQLLLCESARLFVKYDEKDASRLRAEPSGVLCVVLPIVFFGSGLHRRDVLQGQDGAEGACSLRAVRDAVPEQTEKDCRKEHLPHCERILFLISLRNENNGAYCLFTYLFTACPYNRP